MMSNYRFLRRRLVDELLEHGKEVDVGEWHSMDVKGNAMLVSHEITHRQLKIAIPGSKEALQEGIEPNLPWAEDHFQERVSGFPLNPPPSNEWWPFAMSGNAIHKDGGQFSHTYPERYWPKMANVEGTTPEGRQIFVPHVGLRYMYGDLDDVINLLVKSPLTRQAYLPVWFPEDTGAVNGQRVPCSMGYHFLQRMGRLDVSYFLRSCDFVRHFADDMYMTARLLQHVVGKLREAGQVVREGDMIVTISSLHYFNGDRSKMLRLQKEWRNGQNDT